MPAPFGVTPDGFSAKSLEEIKAEIEAQLRSEIDPALNVSAASVLGQMIGIFSSKLREVWELAQAAYSGQYPDSASFFSLDNVGAITGTARREASASTAVIQCDLNGGTTLPAGSAVSQFGNSAVIFELDAEFTAPAGPAANYELAFTATVTGPVSANAGTLAVIDTPVSGWNSAINLLDAVVGADVEDDTAYRARRASELRAAGGSTVAAIQADMLAESTLRAGTAYPGVLAALVFENVGSVVDTDGLPPKSIEVVIHDVPALADDLIAQRIWESKAGGIETVGSAMGTATDSSGRAQVQRFSRVVERKVGMEITLTVDALYAGDAAIKEAVRAWGDAHLAIGDPVIRAQLFCPILAVDGVLDVAGLQIGFVPGLGLGADNLITGSRELAVIDTSLIFITVLS